MVLSLNQDTVLIDMDMDMELGKNSLDLFKQQKKEHYNDDGCISNYASTGMFYILVVLLIFGVYFNETLNMESVDEIIEFIFCVIFFKAFINNNLKRKLGLDVKIFICLLIFYPIYSINQGFNTTKSILIDVIIQIKPYVAFFTIYYLGICLTSDQKIALKKVIKLLFVFSILSLVVLLLLPGSLNHGLYKLYGHTSKFYTGLIILGLLHLYCSEYNIRNLLIYFFIISFGLITMKGKMYGFFFASIMLSIFLKRGLVLRFSLKNIMFCIILILGIFWVAQEKISFYFFGNFDSEHALARPLLYLTSVEIIKDFFPFGSGLASFATHASRVTYSNLYYDYDLDNIWGLSPETPDFIADTYYPSLAQFGILGLFCFLLFWTSLIKKLNKFKTDIIYEKYYMIGVFIIFFLGIELVADATYTNNRGFMIMVIFALVLNEYKLGDKPVVESQL